MSGSENVFDGATDEGGGQLGKTRPGLAGAVERQREGKKEVASTCRYPTIAATPASAALVVGGDEFEWDGITCAGAGKEIVVC